MHGAPAMLLPVDVDHWRLRRHANAHLYAVETFKPSLLCLRLPPLLHKPLSDGLEHRLIWPYPREVLPQESVRAGWLSQPLFRLFVPLAPFKFPIVVQHALQATVYACRSGTLALLALEAIADEVKEAP